MTPLFAKFFPVRSSSRSTRGSTDRRASVDSYASSASYVISLPSVRDARRTSFSPSFSSSASTDSTAEMMDDDNLAWGRPSRRQRAKAGWSRP
ncbi:hypothetical protein C2E23DRAFT_890695 [Lenzites betulinus]|nr:hypothetical protein C2E23DRAFT_890695 [Lenzites betulinus]